MTVFKCSILVVFTFKVRNMYKSKDRYAYGTNENVERFKKKKPKYEVVAKVVVIDKKKTHTHIHTIYFIYHIYIKAFGILQ